MELFWTALLIVAALAGTGVLGLLARRLLATRPAARPVADVRS